MRVDDDDDTTATATVAAVGTAVRHVLFPQETAGARAAVAGARDDADAIDEHKDDEARAGVCDATAQKLRRVTLSGDSRQNVNAAVRLVELHHAVDQREKRVIAADADVRRRDENGCRAGGPECCRR